MRLKTLKVDSSTKTELAIEQDELVVTLFAIERATHSL